MDNLGITYCKNCKFYKKTFVNKNSTIETCTKSSDRFQPDDPQLFCYRKCFREKRESNGQTI